MTSKTFLTKDIWCNINSFLTYDERFILSKVSKINNKVFWNYFRHPEIFEIGTRNYQDIKDILSKWTNHNFKIDLSYDDYINDINFLKEYNNIGILDIRFCNLIIDLSDYSNIKQIIVAGNIHPSLYNLPNINITTDSHENWKELHIQNKYLIKKTRVIMYNPIFDRSKVPRGGWCNPIYTGKGNKSEKELLFLVGVYYDKITSRISDISKELIENSDFKGSKLINIQRSEKLFMGFFQQKGPLHPIINCIFDLTLSKKEICDKLYKNIFFSIIKLHGLD